MGETPRLWQSEFDQSGHFCDGRTINHVDDSVRLALQKNFQSPLIFLSSGRRQHGFRSFHFVVSKEQEEDRRVDDYYDDFLCQCGRPEHVSELRSYSTR